MRIYGTSAYCGSGQDTLADIICEHLGLPKFSIGDVAREIALNRGLKPTREALQEIRIEYNKKYGSTFFIEKILEKCKLSKKPCFVTGFRKQEEYLYFKCASAFTLIFVTANTITRFERLKARGTSRDPKTIPGFIMQELQEQRLFDVGFLKRNADIKIDCDAPSGIVRENITHIIKKVPGLNTMQNNLHTHRSYV